MGIFVLVFLMVTVFVIIYTLTAIIEKFNEKNRLNKANEEVEMSRQHLLKQVEQETDSLFERLDKLEKKYGLLSPEEIIFNKKIEYSEQIIMLEWWHNYTHSEAEELYDTAQKEARKAKLSEVKRNIAKKVQEAYGIIPSDDKRITIPDEVKMFVWQRDNGKCVKCGNSEDLEYDHIIPFSKGGSNTKRNIQLLCEKCNRSKHDNII